MNDPWLHTALMAVVTLCMAVALVITLGEWRDSERLDPWMKWVFVATALTVIYQIALCFGFGWPQIALLLALAGSLVGFVLAAIRDREEQRVYRLVPGIIAVFDAQYPDGEVRRDE